MICKPAGAIGSSACAARSNMVRGETASQARNDIPPKARGCRTPVENDDRVSLSHVNATHIRIMHRDSLPARGAFGRNCGMRHAGNTSGDIATGLGTDALRMRSAKLTEAVSKRWISSAAPLLSKFGA